VLRLAGVCSSTEVQGAVHPIDSQRHDVRFTVWTHRCHPIGMPIGSARTRNLSKTLFQALANLRPRDKRRTIAIEILLGLWLALYRCHFLLSFTFFLHVDPGLHELLTWYLQTSSLEVLIRYPSAP